MMVAQTVIEVYTNTDINRLVIDLFRNWCAHFPIYICGIELFGFAICSDSVIARKPAMLPPKSYVLLHFAQ